MPRFLITLLLSLLCLPGMADNTCSFAVGPGCFTMDGKPFQVKAAELHYPRIPREYWEHRIEMCKALGMNTICIYVFWNLHEPTPGEFDFTGQNDVAAFVELADKHGMKVIVRPGPYVCAEWEMGGLPWWLLQNRDVRLREDDPYFLERVQIFEERLGRELAPYTADKGGPIIMVQVENEYGSYGKSPEYIAKIRDIVKHAGFDKVALFQCDWASNFQDNALADLLWTMNFGTGADIDAQFAELKRLRPDSPLMCSEYWSGWFDKWGAAHETRPAEAMVDGLREMLEKGISFSLYMTHGGTSFGHWAGANSPGYAPDVTSYDYDAPINEQGAPTPKYFLLRDMMQQHSAEPLPAIPAQIPVREIAEFQASGYLPLTAAIRAEHVSEGEQPATFEELGYGWGAALYSAKSPVAAEDAVLTVEHPNDYVQVFVGNQKRGVIDRIKGETSVHIGKVSRGEEIRLLVDAMGRINFGRAIADRKGLSGEITLNGQPLTGWKSQGISDELPDNLKFKSLPQGALQPGIYKASFELDSADGDTYLDMSEWGKGMVYVNGNALGRFWNIGPQQTLYLPGPWLQPGVNEVIVVDYIGPKTLKLRGLKAPINNVVNAADADASLQQSYEIPAGAFKQIHTSTESGGWQKMVFDKPLTANHLALMLDQTQGGIAEIYLLDSNGRRVSRDAWRVEHVSSQKREGNHTAEKLFDIQETTWWQPADNQPNPFVVIDLGAAATISALEYLPQPSDKPLSVTVVAF